MFMLINKKDNFQILTFIWRPGLEVIKLDFSLKLKMRIDWLLADMCPQAANHCALMNSSFITLRPGLL